MEHFNYEADAASRLSKAGATIEIKRAENPKLPNWAQAGEPYGRHYRVTLATKDGRYTFDFWGSIHDRETGREASPYDVMACLQWYTPESFKDFCNEYGYETETPHQKSHAAKIWKACLHMTERLNQIFPDQPVREMLAEIR